GCKASTGVFPDEGVGYEEGSPTCNCWNPPALAVGRKSRRITARDPVEPVAGVVRQRPGLAHHLVQQWLPARERGPVEQLPVGPVEDEVAGSGVAALASGGLVVVALHVHATVGGLR